MQMRQAAALRLDGRLKCADTRVRLTDRERKRLVAGAACGLQNRCPGLTRRGVGSIPMRFRQPRPPSSEHDARALARPSTRLEAAEPRADFTLEVGQVTEAIDVLAEAIAVKTSSGDVSNVITDRQLEGIALNGRNYSQLLRLVPGAMATNWCTRSRLRLRN